MDTTLMGTGSIEALSRQFSLEGFRGAYGARTAAFRRDPVWAVFRELGTRLWLDTGSNDEAAELWTSEFTHITTNNTLVNREVQKGVFDDLIVRVARDLRSAVPEMDSNRLVFEIGFILNCRVALRLVEAFDAYVSVELHPDVAHDVQRTVELARRYYRISPERFIIKIPLTPAGYLAVKQLSKEGMPVNFTLGFSNRQNYLAALLARPRFVNVFMGRLNQFVADNGLGDGKLVGEKATLSTQLSLWKLRDSGRADVSRLIGASTRNAQQVIDLAGIDVFTLPPAVAREVHERLSKSPVRLACCAEKRFEPRFVAENSTAAAIVSTLWDLSDNFCKAVWRVESDPNTVSSPEALIAFLKANGAPNLFRSWSEAELNTLRLDGKIPRYERWKEELRSGALALDDLMSTSALQAFAGDQQALDERICGLLPGG